MLQDTNKIYVDVEDLDQDNLPDPPAVRPDDKFTFGDDDACGEYVLPPG